MLKFTRSRTPGPYVTYPSQEPPPKCGPAPLNGNLNMPPPGHRQSLITPPSSSSGGSSSDLNLIPHMRHQWRNGGSVDFVAVANQQRRETSFIMQNGHGKTKRAAPPPPPPAPPPPPPPPPLPPKDFGPGHGQVDLRKTAPQGHHGERNMDERLRRYEQAWQKENHRQSREEPFLRPSIHTSEALKALEKSSHFTNGHTNGAFISDKDDDDGYNKMPDLTKDITSEKRLYRPRTRSSVGSHSLHQRSNSSSGHQSAVDLANVLINLQQHRRSDACLELKDILSKPEFKSLMHAHDDITRISPKSEHRPSLDSTTFVVDQQSWQWGSIETPLDDESGNLRIVRLYKHGDNPLGATVVQEGKAVTIGRIIKGGVAEKSGLLHEGDELVEVNGIDLRSMSVHEVCDLLTSMRGELVFVIAPKTSADLPYPESQPAVKHLRALFDYDPDEDYYLPCRELGLSFRKGDILHVISITDSNWWQAHRNGEENNTLAGLIPSTNFQIQRECCRLEKASECQRKNQRNVSADRNGGSGFWCARRRKDKKRSTSVFVSDGRKIASISITNDGGMTKKPSTEPLDVLTYEEVTLHLSKTGRKRPIVLVAPAYVGHRHLLQKLMEMKTEMFAKVVYHTSRPRKANEQDGARYYFLNRQQFLEYVNKKKFVEWGEYDKHYYGTSYDSIRRVIDQGKTCILTLKPQSLKGIRNGEIRPYIVYISPPPFERLKSNAQRDAVRSGKPCPKDEELRNIINEAVRIEEKFGHFFDKTLVSFDLEACAQELLNDIQKLDMEPQWVPVSWLQH